MILSALQRGITLHSLMKLFWLVFYHRFSLHCPFPSRFKLTIGFASFLQTSKTTEISLNQQEELGGEATRSSQQEVITGGETKKHHINTQNKKDDLQVTNNLKGRPSGYALGGIRTPDRRGTGNHRSIRLSYERKIIGLFVADIQRRLTTTIIRHIIFECKR